MKAASNLTDRPHFAREAVVVGEGCHEEGKDPLAQILDHRAAGRERTVDDSDQVVLKGHAGRAQVE